jgi:transcription antitermination factor NusG
MVVVRQGHELDAVDSMRRHGLLAYWPSYERLVASRRRFEGMQIRRLIRSGVVPYIFTPVGEGNFLDEKHRIVAVLDIVRTFSGTPLFLLDRDIEIVRRIEARLNTPKPEATEHDFKSGDKVRFTDDVNRHWPPGRVVKLAKDGRIIVDVNLKGRVVPFTVFPFQIERT